MGWREWGIIPLPHSDVEGAAHFGIMQYNNINMFR
jgi:hypothetical protein